MKVQIGWRNTARGGGLVSGPYVTPSMVTFWFTVSRSRLGERHYYLNMLSIVGSKLRHQKIKEVPTNVSAARVAEEAKKFITKFVKENKGTYNEYN